MNLDYKYTREYDVVVCGLGSAGFTAAVMCGRLGLRCAAVEKYHMPGGVMTVLGNNSIDQFNNPFADGDKLVITGIGWEFVNRLAAMGGAAIPDMDAEYKYHWQYGVKVNPTLAASLMNDMLIEAGVDLYYGQGAADVVCSDACSDGDSCRDDNNGVKLRRIDGVAISTKSGLALLRADNFIDCTGDGDLVAYSGFDYLTGDDGVVQPGSIHGGGKVIELACHASDSDRLTLDEIAARRKLASAGADSSLCAPAIAPRESRRAVCQVMMNSDDYMNGVVYPDSVAYTFWFIDIHREGREAVIRYLRSPRTPTIRLGAMLPVGAENLIVAGRCVGSDRETNSAIRVKSSCMAMGQAAGAAVYTAKRRGVRLCQTADDANIAEVKRILKSSGARVPE
ncbi:MAG TPA: FAD-dependent oxidoreductase [Firmicutes bacterium]|nr:FAD-dependent oxidoreductase [Bacillota bacterium]